MQSNVPEHLATFAALEHRGWQQVAAEYGDHFAAVTLQSAGALLDAAVVHAGTRLLDVACGPGQITAAAADRGAIAIGLDFSAVMVAAAARRYPGVRFTEGDAQALPFAPETFDAITIGFGMLHFPDADRAIAEAFRVLKSGGHIAFSVWSTPDRAVGFQMLTDAVVAHGRTDVGLPDGPPVHRFSEPETCIHVLRTVGFVEPEVVEVPQTWHLDEPGALFDVLRRATVRAGALIRAQEPAALERLSAAVRSAAEAYRDTDGRIRLPMHAVIAGARKP
ncbi:MAG: methyltransferase domain-containing protein [Burkholderiales bacterium]|nr:methyltransferase domain-containing protein [Burkholderiales bacterium]